MRERAGNFARHSHMIVKPSVSCIVTSQPETPVWDESKRRLRREGYYSHIHTRRRGRTRRKIGLSVRARLADGGNSVRPCSYPVPNHCSRYQARPACGINNNGDSLNGKAGHGANRCGFESRSPFKARNFQSGLY